MNKKEERDKLIRKFKADSNLTKEERGILNIGEYRLNQVKCLKCEEVIRSKHVHDFVTCSCGNISVDGGSWYLKRVGKGIADKTYEDLSEEYVEDEEDV